jgi:hypothetical protein
LDRMMDSVKETMAHNYKTLTPTNQPGKSVTFRLEDPEHPTFANQDGYETEEITTAEIHLNLPEIEENQHPPPLPEKSKKKNKFAGIPLPIITTRPKLRKSKKQTMAGYLEMKRSSAPAKPPRLEPRPDTTQVLQPLLDE